MVPHPNRRFWLLAAVLAALLVASAVGASNAAASFPTTESIDTFERAAENPLSNGGKWSKLAWTKTIGRVWSQTFGWVPKEGGSGAPESEADGAYWNAQTFTNPAVSVHVFPESRPDYVALWSDTTGSGSKNGYRLKVVGTGSNNAFKLILEKWVNGARTQLAESAVINFEAGSDENTVGITEAAGKVIGWYGKTEAALSVQIEASDSTFTQGYIGLEGTDSTAFGETKYRAGSNPPEQPSGAAMPLGDVPGWHQIAADDFTKPAPVGSWAVPQSEPEKIVYEGDHGAKWHEYPDGWPCAQYTNCYEPGQVLSVHDGVLDYNLHQCTDGLPCGAVPSIAPPGSSGYLFQTYGRYSARFKVEYGDAFHLDQYHIAWLLWPQEGGKGLEAPFAESDYPEADLNQTEVCAFAHYGGAGVFDYFCPPIDFTQWHTYTQEWEPGHRRYYLDGNLIGTSITSVYEKPEVWQLQTEAHNKGDTGSGHLLVDWVAVYARA